MKKFSFKKKKSPWSKIKKIGKPAKDLKNSLVRRFWGLATRLEHRRNKEKGNKK